MKYINYLKKIISLIKVLYFKTIYYGKLHINIKSFISKNSVLEMEGKESTIIIDKGFACGRNVKIRSIGGIIKIDKDVFINDNCSIISRKKIVIGENSLLGPNICIYDHDHKYNNNLIIKEQGYNLGEIKIGKNVWIGSNTIILKDVTIGDNVVIAAGTIVKKDIPDNSIVYNEKNLIIKSK